MFVLENNLNNHNKNEALYLYKLRMDFKEVMPLHFVLVELVHMRVKNRPHPASGISNQ